MKILFENWRKHLNEEAPPNQTKLYKTKVWEEMTVSEVGEWIDHARKGELEGDYSPTATVQHFLKMGGSELVKIAAEKAVEGAGLVLTGVEHLVNYTFDINKKRRAGKKDTLEGWPILDILDLDPTLVEYIEDDVLKVIDEEYQKYLMGRPFDTKMKNLMNINEFLQVEIARKTGRTLWIVLRKK